MKSKYLLLALTGSALTFTACEDLDTYPLGDNVTSDQKGEIAESLPERAEAGVTAIFAQFTQYGPNETALNSFRHNDIGYPTIMMAMDANTEDVVSDNNGYNWTGSSLEFDDRVYTSMEAQMVWNDLYQIIFNANNVIASIDPATTEPLTQFYLAQALAGRAFSYMTLAQLYQFNYVGNESKPCVPIVTNENANDAALNGSPRSTVEEVYALVKADLDKSIELFGAAKQARKDKRYMDIATAYGLRARMNLVMHKYAEAAADATKAIENSDAQPSSLEETGLPAFWTVDEQNWMWGIVVAETDDIVSSGIVNYPSHIGTFNYGYCWYSGGRQISKKLYNMIPESDVRKSWWADDKAENKRLTPAYQEFLKEFAYKPYTSCKFAPYRGYSDVNLGVDMNANDIPLMRIEEMYFIKAEGEAMASGNTTTLVEFMKTYRNPQYAITASSIQEEIYNQRRVEFWGEGLAWFDVMRLNKGVDRRGSGFPNPTSVFNIPAGDPLLLWRLPESEIQANPALEDKDNNPSAPAPQPVPDFE